MGFSSLREQYLNNGKNKFYRSIILLALEKIISISENSFKGTYPDIEYLNYHDKLYILYKKDGDETYLEMAILFRKAAHKIHRVLLRKKLVLSNNRFLTLV